MAILNGRPQKPTSNPSLALVRICLHLVLPFLLLFASMSELTPKSMGNQAPRLWITFLTNN